MTTILREKVALGFMKRVLALKKVLEEKQSIRAKIEGEWYFIPYTGVNQARDAIQEAAAIGMIAAKAKTILFHSEQAQVFTNVNQSYFDALDFRLPFDHVFLQFDRPVLIDYELRFDQDFDRGKLIAIAMRQIETTKNQHREAIEKTKELDREMGIEENNFFEIVAEHDDTPVVLNQVCFLYQDWGTEFLNWQAGTTNESLVDEDVVRNNAMQMWRNVAVACIGYINCENIHLERIEQAAEAINAKRERKGKSRLEPYYICRIRGVQYDSTDPTGTGAKHGIRYDVRGHFRRLQTGKTTWVRPHQRGLQNELYVPKTYLVDKVRV
jgi:hypothetical protein